MYRLRVKTKGGGQFPLTDQVNGDSTLAELLSAIQDITSVAPERQKILTGTNTTLFFFFFFFDI